MHREGVDAIVVPTDDPHMSEYTAPHFYRREFISGFTGSAGEFCSASNVILSPRLGTAVVTLSHACLFTDGRYHSQAAMELSQEWTLMRVGVKDVPGVNEFLSSNLSSATIGIDPLVHSAAAYLKLKQAIETNNNTIKCLDRNIVDEVWGEARPPAPNGKFRVHPLEYAGVSVTEKLASLRRSLNEKKQYAIVSSALDEIMWLFNIRGSDIPCNPVGISYAIVTLDEAIFFVDGGKLNFEVISHLNSNGVIIDAYDNVIDGIKLAARRGSVWMDSRTVNFKLFEYALRVIVTCH